MVQLLHIMDPILCLLSAAILDRSAKQSQPSPLGMLYSVSANLCDASDHELYYSCTSCSYSLELPRHDSGDANSGQSPDFMLCMTHLLHRIGEEFLIYETASFGTLLYFSRDIHRIFLGLKPLPMISLRLETRLHYKRRPGERIVIQAMQTGTTGLNRARISCIVVAVVSMAIIVVQGTHLRPWRGYPVQDQIFNQICLAGQLAARLCSNLRALRRGSQSFATILRVFRVFPTKNQKKHVSLLFSIAMVLVVTNEINSSRSSYLGFGCVRVAKGLSFPSFICPILMTYNLVGFALILGLLEEILQPERNTRNTIFQSTPRW
ncbi:hypothetical protein CVT25_011695 [Psilocybe cyanescens]|uniref:Uncharacterized protein n=1 Tax=Psilocybe cyanescens TaxID=93625 RepID=A0A409WIH2_PSICY|nr:hypothetical protein CVT25_011695 [Psilocybe cyanescens]